MGMPATPRDVTTLEEFFALPEDGVRRHELLDGTYVVSPEASLRHQRAAFALGRILLPALTDRPDLELFALPGDIVLDQRTVVEPDLFVIPRPGSAEVHWCKGPWREASDLSAGRHSGVLDRRSGRAPCGALAARRRAPRDHSRDSALAAAGL